MRLQRSPALAPGSWADVEIPGASATINGVEFIITPLPGGNLNQIKAVFPAGPSGRFFVRLAAAVAGS